MKKKGFTLIELIVVIAIIGVLAAILVPAMVGYIKKSKITSANSSAKSILTGAQSAITDMDAEDVTNAQPNKIDEYVAYDRTNATWKCGGVAANLIPVNQPNAAGGVPTAAYIFTKKIEQYFSDFNKINIALHVDNSQVKAVAVLDNSGYAGSNPRQFTVEEYDAPTQTTHGSSARSINLFDALAYAET